MRADALRSGRWTVIPLALVVILLIGSVLIPAGESWRIMRLLAETSGVIEPARLKEARLELGLAVESGLLQEYALVGDSTVLERYRAAVADDDRLLAELEQLARRLDASAERYVIAIRDRLDQWRRLDGDLAEGHLSSVQSVAAVRAQRDEYDAVLAEMTTLASYLADQSATRRELVRASERAGLVANASLVFVAIAAVFAVAALINRERRLALALERVMQSRSRLMRGFSHDVKNPLGAADGYAALLGDGIFGPLRDEQRESIERMRASIHTALALIDDLHDLARAETGNVALSPSLVAIAPLLHACGEEYHAAASARGLSLEVEVPPDVSVETDAARVRQIVGNLVSNAIKYTETGSVRLRARYAGSRQEHPAASGVAIDVIDTGPGIPRDKQASVFDEFSRLAANDKPGAGLGLAISRRLAAALGGSLTVESEAGRGSTFTLHLPGRWREDPVSLEDSSDAGRPARKRTSHAEQITHLHE